MNRLILSWVFLTAGLIPLASLAVDKGGEHLFKTASIDMERGDYNRAINSLESLRNKGVVSPNLYCNLGNAYYNAGLPGKAIFCYERGLVLFPFDTGLLHNRNYVLTQLHIPAAPGNADQDIIILYFVKYGMTFAALLFLISGLIFLAYSFRIFDRHRNIIRTTFKSCLVTLVCFVIALSIIHLYNDWDIHAVVLNENVAIKKGPGSKAKNTYSLREGENVKIQNHYKNWYKIKRYDNTEGWVDCKDIGLIR